MSHQCNSMFNCACGSPLWKSIFPADFKISDNTNKPSKTSEDIIFQTKNNGTILTMRGGQKETVEAVGVREGKVWSMGTADEVIKSFNDKNSSTITYNYIEGKNTLLPAFIEPHTHIIPSAVINTGTNLSPFYGQYLREDYNQKWVLNELQEAANIDQNKNLILGHNVDPSLFTNSMKLFNADILDEVETNSPIMVFNTSGHLAYINSKSIQKVDNHNKDLPENLKISTGTNGVLAEFSEILPVINVLIDYKNMSSSDKEASIKSIELEIQNIFDTAVKRGATYMLDAALDKDQCSILKKIAAREDCPVRIGGAYLIDSLSKLESDVIDIYQPNEGDEYFNLAFLKLVTDGSAQGLTAYQYTPYDCNENYDKYAFMSNPHLENEGGTDKGDEQDKNAQLQNIMGLFNYGYPLEFNALLATANNYGWPTMIHANGDHAIDRTLNAFKAAGINASTIEQRRDRIEHCSLLTEKNMTEMAQLGVSPSFTIGHVGYWGWHFKSTIIGEQRADQLDLCRSTLNDHNMRITLHCDYSVTPLGPLRMMEQSITRLTEDAPDQNKAHHVLNPSECITPFQALKAVTYDAAWQCHADQWVGSIEVGKCADFVILEQSPLTYQNKHNMAHPAQGMRDIPVLETWKGGKCVYPFSL